MHKIYICFHSQRYKKYLYNMHQKFVIIIGRSVSIKSSKKNIVMIDSVLMNMWIQNVITAMTVLKSLL